MTKDAVVMVSQYIAHIQTITSRATDPMDATVLNVGKVEAGVLFNIIAENAKLEGTVRTFDAKTRDIVETEMKRYAERTATMYGGTVKFKYHRVLDSVINETQSAQLVQSIARNSSVKIQSETSHQQWEAKILVSTRTILIVPLRQSEHATSLKAQTALTTMLVSMWSRNL